jgi:enoyl-CoA hydratase/carnithine racemase
MGELTKVDFCINRPADGVALVTLDRPAARNAITTAMQRALDAALQAIHADEGVRAVVITGAGEQAFSAGYDVKELATFDEDAMHVNYLERQGLMGAVATFPKPLIGAINGAAHGGGAILATLCDIRIGGARTDFRFTAAAYNGVNNTWQLPPLVGLAKALEFTMTAKRIDATEALQCGLLNHVVADDRIVEFAIEMASLIASHPSPGVQWHKALMRQNVGRSILDAYAAENAVMNGPLRPGRPAQVFEAFLEQHPKR